MLVDGADEVGGSRVYGGAILSKSSRSNDKWLKVKRVLSVCKRSRFVFIHRVGFRRATLAKISMYMNLCGRQQKFPFLSTA